MGQRKKVLDLITAADITVATVDIDGSEYELTPIASLSFAQVAMIQHAGQRIQTLLQKTDLQKDEEYAGADEALTRALGKIMQAPDEVIARLSAADRLKIIQAWQQAYSGEPPNPLAPTIPQPSPQDSSDSTEPPTQPPG